MPDTLTDPVLEIVVLRVPDEEMEGELDGDDEAVTDKLPVGEPLVDSDDEADTELLTLMDAEAVAQVEGDKVPLSVPLVEPEGLTDPLEEPVVVVDTLPLTLTVVEPQVDGEELPLTDCVTEALLHPE